MSSAPRTAGVMLSVALANMLQYRAVMLLWAAWGIVAPLVSLAVWTAAGRGREIGGFDAGELAGYFMVTMVITHMTTAWDPEVFGWLIRSGELSSRLLRPMHPVWQSVADNIGYKLCTSAILLPIWALLWWTLRPTLHLTPERALWLLPAVGLSACLTFIWGYCVALAAFWTTNVRAINELYWTAMIFMAGRMAPLGLLPAWLQTIASALPFRWMLAFPAELALGRVPDAQIPVGIAWQLFWLAAGIALFNLVWSRGIRQHSAVGA